MERGQALDVTLTRSAASTAERDAVARLLGRPVRVARGLSVALPAVDAVLRRAGVHDEGLAGAVVTLTGPVPVRADVASAEARAWAAAFASIERAVRDLPAAAWLAGVRSTGLVKRLAGGSPTVAAELLGALARVVAALPCTPPESLAGFSARVIGRAHALDDGTPLGTLALGAARALSGLAPPQPGSGESPSEARREAWAAVGVLCDELSSMVLTLGLSGNAILAAAQSLGAPAWVTLHELVRRPPDWTGVETVLIVENPSVVALAADVLGRRCPPLVCTNGQPRAAAMVLLRSLAGAGVSLRHHGDFDWPGIAIGNLLRRRLPVDSWNYDAAAYREAAAAHAHTAPLTGAAVTASWDPGLAEAMRATGRQIEEELVASRMIEKLWATPS